LNLLKYEEKRNGGTLYLGVRYFLIKKYLYCVLKDAKEKDSSGTGSRICKTVRTKRT
jgi:hypothetical protein